MKRQLIEEWRSAWKWMSVNCMALVVAIQLTWVNMPPDLKSALPDGLVNYVSIGLLVLGVFGRVTTKAPQ